MKTVNYRTKTIIGRIMLCVGFILTGVALILASMYLEAPTLRKVISVTAGVLGIAFFGRMAIMLIILLFKDKQMFCYDKETITIRDKSFKLDTIKDVEEENNIPTGYLGIKTPAYVLNAAGGERIYIPTFYVISKKDYPVILQTLKEIVSDRTKR
ncbi:DUF5381 family protein [Bacillus sp. ISL-55]|jgi:hypothetical protein|uniref:DUF5381 family protein n=1 Tax=Bacillus sp. ISL-55 TaxID=2819134 RepID=UPI001BE55725|nr:DUF5381 family protein [Bacillus sp. ISL-55]MBT2694773.1 DUF5381 family protein [Bacillus sp. ISL-55]